MTHDTFETGDLTAVIGGNAADEKAGQRQGYNGIWSLRHAKSNRSFFVPGIAGLNFEHIISGSGEQDREVFFEPRRCRMEFRRTSESKAELYQPPTKTFFLESWTSFELVAPHYIDMTFRCRATQHVFDRGYICLFWASYMNGPEDKSIYFRGGREKNPVQSLWQQLKSPVHNRDSTVRAYGDNFEMTFEPGAPDALYKNFAPLRFSRPFYYGNFDDFSVIYLFDPGDGIRFTMSPSGGGVNKEEQTTNPAWDFSFLIPEYEIAAEYSFRMRAVFRPKCSRDEVDREYANWAKVLR